MAQMALSQREVAQLAEDREAFDTKVVRSAVDFYNDLGPNRPGGNQGVNDAAIVENSFGWVPQVVEHMAGLMGIPGSVKWRAEDWHAWMAAHKAVAAFVRGGWLFNPFRSAAILGLDGAAHMKWLNDVLRGVAVRKQYGWDGRRVFESELPILSGVQACVAYAVALIRLNRHGLGDRVRACGFAVDESKLDGHHLFLAPDMKMKFCCPKHENAQQQRRHRARKNKPRRASR